MDRRYLSRFCFAVVLLSGASGCFSTCNPESIYDGECLVADDCETKYACDVIAGRDNNKCIKLCEKQKDCGPGELCTADKLCRAPVGGRCKRDGDCPKGPCVNLLCTVSECLDGVQNGSETAIDCGGSCGGCALGQACGLKSDCESLFCNSNRSCDVPSCTDGFSNGTETGLNCGGDCPRRCSTGEGCLVDGDCVDKVCDKGFGGPCAGDTAADCVCLARTCSDRAVNGTETDLNCGGTDCPERCAAGLMCGEAGDCLGGCDAVSALCVPTCDDGVMNQDETAIDCGGGCGGCVDGQTCKLGTDCQSGACSETQGICLSDCPAAVVESNADFAALKNCWRVPSLRISGEVDPMPALELEEITGTLSIGRTCDLVESSSNAYGCLVRWCGPGCLRAGLATDLQHVDGLSRLRTANRVLIGEAAALDNLDGLANLATLPGALRLSQTGIGNLSGLGGLESLPRILIVSSNNRLNSLTGLEGVSGDVQALVVSGHSSAPLTSLAGLEGVKSVCRSLDISGSLTDISVLSGVTSPCPGLNLTVLSTPLESLESLSGITSVGLLDIAYNSNLADLVGLEGITTAGEVLVELNGKLANLDGLRNLESAGRFVIGSNPSLLSLPPFTRFTSGHVTIAGNSNLASITGFANLGGIVDVQVSDNAALTTISGFGGVIQGGGVSVRNNSALTSILGFSKMTEVYGLEMLDNPVLTNIGGFGALATVKNSLSIRRNCVLSQATANALRDQITNTGLNYTYTYSAGGCP